MSHFNFSAPAGTTPQTTASAEPLWSFHGVQSFPGPSGTVVLHKRDGDRRMMVQPDVAQALSLCSPFRTLTAHTKSIIDALPPLAEHRDHTLQILTNIAEAGLFERSDAAWERLTQNEAPAAGNSIRVFILTCDRPAALQRLLEGLQQSALPAEAEGLWVIDDSRDAAHITHNAELIAAAYAALNVPVHHVNAGLKQSLVQHIISEAPEAERALAWLLHREHWGDTPTYGVARNLSLLLSAGHRALVLDDDTLPTAIAPPLSTRALKPATANDREGVFYADTEELDRHALALPDSPLLLMAKHLGMPLAAVMKQHLPNHRELAGWDGSLLSTHQGDAPVLLTQCGSWGDSGTGDGSGLVFLGDSTIKRLIKMDAPIEEVLAARAGWLGYRGPTLTQYGTLSQLTGLDHRALLPPYLPAGRGEDILFGIMLQRLHPESVVFNEEWAIHHAPLESRTARGALPPLSATASTSLLGDWLGVAPADDLGLSPERRLAGLAEQLERLASMETSAMEDLARASLVSKRTNLLNHCMAHLTKRGPEEGNPRAGEWRAFLEASRDQLVVEIQRPEPAPISDASERLGDDGMQTLRAHGQNFAQALRVWPAICEAARSFAAE